MIRKFINPFIYVAGLRALLIGLAAILLSALLAWSTNTHFDGIFDIHFWEARPLHIHIFLGLINWLVLSFVFGLTAVLLSRTRFRLIDLLGTMAMARIPYNLAVLIPLVSDPNAMSDYFLRSIPMSGAQIAGMALGGLISLITIVWAVAWTYQAYSTVANLKGAKAVLSFIGAFIFAAIIDKILLGSLLGYHFLPNVNM